MGQRLVLNFTLNGQSQVVLYRYWGGFTEPALESLSELSNLGHEHHLFDIKDNSEKMRILLRVLLHMGHIEDRDTSGIAHWSRYLSDAEIINNRSKEPISVQRNTGLVTIESNAIKDHLDYAQMIVDIDIETFHTDLTQVFDADEHSYLVDYHSENTVENVLKVATPLECDNDLDITDSMEVDDLCGIVTGYHTSYLMKHTNDTVFIDFR